MIGTSNEIGNLVYASHIVKIIKRIPVGRGPLTYGNKFTLAVNTSNYRVLQIFSPRLCHWCREKIPGHSALLFSKSHAIVWTTRSPS